MTVDEVRVQIERAWQDMKQPDSAHIANDAVPEAALVASFFRGMQWTDVTLEALEAYPGDASRCLGFMSADAFRYFVASYMLMALRRYEYPTADNWTIGTAAVYGLNAKPFGSFREGDVALFTPGQASAIVAFLLFIARELSDDYPMGEASNAFGFWSRWVRST